MNEELPEPFDKNSMLYWFPKLKKLGMDMPQTEFVNLKIPDEENINLECPREWDAEEIEKAIEEVGGYPVFVRTDYASAKHQMNRASRIESPDQIDSHIFEVICHNELASLVGLPYKVLAVREWIDILSEFKAFSGGIKIGAELRFFIRDGKIECWHYYWPEDSVRKPSKESWKELLKHMESTARRMVVWLWPQLKKIAQEFEGWWSVDAALTTDMDWYIIDMARGEESYHDPHCENAPEEMKRRYLEDSE